MHVSPQHPVNESGREIRPGPECHSLARQYLTPQLRRAVEFSRRLRSATIGPLGGSCSISAIHFTANRVSPTSKRILSLITSSAEGSFGNLMMRCRGAFSFVAPLPPSVQQG